MKTILKGCRRCGGDLLPDRSDRAEHTLSCLQCGREVTVRTVLQVWPFSASVLPAQDVTTSSAA